MPVTLARPQEGSPCPRQPTAPLASTDEAGAATPLFYDTHAHLGDPRFADDLAQVVERAHAAGIAKIICVGTDLAGSRQAVALSERFPNLYATVGWHPTGALEAPENLRPELRALAQHPKVVAIGETGLDYFHPPPAQPDGTPTDVAFYRRRQAEVFQQQIEVAAEAGLNVVVHHRHALADCLALLEPFVGRVRGQFHCFEDDGAAAQRVLAAGSLVSFTGLVTYKNKAVARDALAAAPLGSFMLETDSPYLVPEPQRGRVRRCEPAFVRDTAARVAQAKGCSLEELSAATCQAAHAFFRRLA